MFCPVFSKREAIMCALAKRAWRHWREEQPMREREEHVGEAVSCGRRSPAKSPIVLSPNVGAAGVCFSFLFRDCCSKVAASFSAEQLSFSSSLPSSSLHQHQTIIAFSSSRSSCSFRRHSSSSRLGRRLGEKRSEEEVHRSERKRILLFLSR